MCINGDGNAQHRQVLAQVKFDQEM